jgi:hypothetical protein
MTTKEQHTRMVLDLKIFSAKMIGECKDVLSQDIPEWRRKVYEDFLAMYEGYLLAPAEEL